MVEGECDKGCNRRCYGVGIFQYLGDRNANDSIAVFRQETIAAGVSVESLRRRVNLAIDFDRQS
jgi:hypothetical protein